MPWGRLDDSLYDHPKLDALGPAKLAGVGLWALAISWSNRWLTDGIVPADRIRKLGGTATIAERLVVAGLFDRCDESYRIHDFLKFNNSAEQVMAKREQRREAGRRGGLARNRDSVDDSPAPQAHAKRTLSETLSEPSSETLSKSLSSSASPRPVKLTSKVTESLSAVSARAPATTRPTKVGTMTGVGRVDTNVTLDRRQLEAWASFGQEWELVRAAWLARGLRQPPSGTADDEDADSQRAILWQVLDAQPMQLPRWIADAPKGISAARVVAHVLECWHATRDEAIAAAQDQEQRWATERAAEQESAPAAVETWFDPEPSEAPA